MKQIPQIGIGTYQVDGTDIYNVLDCAFGSGYRLIDTAEVYKNETAVGNVLPELLRKHNLTREDIFLTTKVGPRSMGKSKTSQAIENSLNALNTSYIDLYLIHWPGAQGLLPIDGQNKLLRDETWSVLETFVDQGKISHIGVSNYLMHHLEDLLSMCRIKPSVLQNEFHPYFWDNELLNFCQKNDIFFQAYSSLGTSDSKDLIEDDVIKEVAKHHNKDSAQILLRWAIQHGVGVIPKSTDSDHIKSNFQIFDFSLSEEEMSAIDDLRKEEKLCWDPISVV